MKIFFSVILVFISFISFAQLTIVSGKVLNAETGSPMAGASVFAENTTMGTATDAEGNFKLYLPSGGYDLVATFSGYNSSSKRITTSENNPVTFQLKVHEKEMMDIAVVASNEVKNGWEKYGDFFLSEFIGQSANSASCSIKNKDVIHFFFSKRKNRLKITADEPIIIENRALGYNIKYNLDSFTHEYNTKITLYTGSPLFEEMAPANNDQMQQWLSARDNAYNGSLLHFMRSLYNKKLKENKFEIQFVVNNKDSEKAIQLKDYYRAMNYVYYDSTQTVEVKPNQLNVGVIYLSEKPSDNYLSTHETEPKDFQFSILTFLPDESIVIEKNGYFYEQNDITINAYWTWEKVADLLPYDYKFIQQSTEMN